VSELRIKVWVTRFADREALQLQWVDPVTGRKKTRSAGTNCPTIAEEKRGDLEADLNAGRHQDVSRLSWLAFRERFEAEYVAALRPNTRHGYRDTFRVWELLARPAALRGITEATISGFAAALRSYRTKGKGDGLATSTIHLHLEHLHTALAWAARQKLIPAAPDFPSVKVPRRRPRPTAPELVERLIDRAPDQEMRAYLLCGWLAGLRLGEAYSLEWEEGDKAPWLDFPGQQIWFPAHFVKGVEDQWIPLVPQLAAALDALPRHGPHVFPFAGRGGRRISLVGACSRVVRLAKRAGVRLTMHSLRKGFGCRYAGKVPAQVLQRLMRHSDIRITMDFYANVDDAVRIALLGNDLGNTPAATGAESLENQGGGTGG
jgi:integrase